MDETSTSRRHSSAQYQMPWLQEWASLQESNSGKNCGNPSCRAQIQVGDMRLVKASQDNSDLQSALASSSMIGNANTPGVITHLCRNCYLYQACAGCHRFMGGILCMRCKASL